MKNRTMIGAGVVAALACGLAFACGDTDETAPEDGGNNPDATADATSADSSTGDGSSVDGGLDGTLSDGGDGGDAETCPGPAGSLDPTFGDGGMVWLKYRGAQSFALAPQPDGKVVVAGGTQAGFAVLRLLPNGALDPTFGTDGLVTTLIGVTGYFVTVVLQPDGKIVAAGGAQLSGARAYEFAVARYLANGTLDPSFGESGIATTGFGPGPFQDDYPQSLVLQPDGRILVSGFTETNATTATENFALARLNSDGSLDTTFGTNGKLVIDVRGTPDAPGLATVGPGGKITLVGGSATSTLSTARYDVSAVRLNADGTFDTSFADAGVLVADFGTQANSPMRSVAIDPAGRAVLGGRLPGVAGDDFAAVRLLSTGAFDPSFGDGGVATTDFGSSEGSSLAMLQTDGRIVLVGGSNGALAVLRYLPSGALDTSFGVGGRSVTPPPAGGSVVGGSSAISGCSILTSGTWSYAQGASRLNAIGVARLRR